MVDPKTEVVLCLVIIAYLAVSPVSMCMVRASQNIALPDKSLLVVGPAFEEHPARNKRETTIWPFLNCHAEASARSEK